ncbi:MAG: HhH-GPD family protein [Bacteroidetes bacterium]|nr:HhH-GPD family protein [Bacteroidota bacterium]
MLQQTQMSRVLQKYPSFLKKFPDFRALAKARTSEVIVAWRGMGYNNRAVRLQQMSKEVMEKHSGRLPTTVAELDALPGVGRYTANALACFAFGQSVPVVDTNVRRVLQRLFPKTLRKKGEWETARLALPKRSAYNWNQGLMEFGALVCTAAAPKCDVCPVKRFCPSAFPRKVGAKNNSPSAEPKHDGLPNRIYRGRIIEALRNSGRSISTVRIGQAVKPAYRKKDEAWLFALLKKLQKDGLIELKKNRSVSLPA